MVHNASQTSTSVSLVTIDSDSENRRLDNFLISLLPNVPQSRIYKLIRTGQVRVNRGRVKPAHRLQLGAVVRVPPVALDDAKPVVRAGPALRESARNVLYEDESIIVLNKPVGIAVHSGSRHSVGLIEAIRQERSSESGIELVHRLDKDTSGVLVLARNKRTLRMLQAQWRRETDASALRKDYLALVRGTWSGGAAKTVESESVRDKPKSKLPQLPAVAVSRFTLLQQFALCTLVNIELHTGKTHQARQHALQIGQPIAGDRKFGDRIFNDAMRTFGLKRMFLHASKITMIHPSTGRSLTVEAPLPPELATVMENLDNQRI